MSSFWNATGLCRCCLAEGNFKNLESICVFEGKDETFLGLIRETFEMNIHNNNQENSCTICNTCKIVLQDAYLFKKQVLFCEEKFKQYCQIEKEMLRRFGNIERMNESRITKQVYNNNNNNREVTVDNTTHNNNKIYTLRKVCGVTLADRVPNTEVRKRVGLKESVGVKVRKGMHDERMTKQIYNAKYIDESLICTMQTVSGLTYSCIQCDRTFKNRVSILSHLTNYHTGAHKCPKCDRLCPNGYVLRAHYRTHFQKTFKCNICSVTYNSRYHLNEHSRKHLNSNRYKCDMCSKEFKYKSSLKIHMFLHSGGKPKHLCDVCGTSFNDRTNLRIHERSVHLKLRPFTCDVCKATYTAKKHLKSHIITKHLDLKEFRCNICGRMFGSITACVKHEAVHTKIFVCCNVEFQSKGEYLSHIKKFNCKIKHTNGSKNKYMKSKSCEICGKVFASKFTWKRHMSQRHDDDRTRNVTCEICHEKFFDSSSVYRHKYKRHVPNIIQDKTKCNMCHKSYTNLEKHMLAHLNTPYNCNVCDKRFSEVSSRNHHEKYVHSGQRFVCNICNRGYKEKGALRRHRLRAHDVKDLND
ncbi:hypothetical protein K1T71_000878 [Dendrolimus kikuchii]|uniref:Uncharacterized protein n=1 Tax=Dendrolimus kikuchii TaxID=765133 RepID=A0ACC1DHJ2_9NEOP|nr:hypothetical protein K1T71_000878 [Dendrolimus kikuchii]